MKTLFVKAHGMDFQVSVVAVSPDCDFIYVKPVAGRYEMPVARHLLFMESGDNKQYITAAQAQDLFNEFPLKDFT